MPLNKTLQHFLETFEKQNPIQVRVMNMLLETLSISDDVSEMLTFLYREQINHDNLKMFLPPRKPQNIQQASQSKWRGTSITEKAVREYELRRQSMPNKAASPGIKRAEPENEYESSKRFKKVKDYEEAGSSSRAQDEAYRSFYENNLKIADKRSSTQKDSVFFKSLYIPDSIREENLVIDPSCLFPPIQCKLCGLRYPKNMVSAFDLHTEEHRRKNNTLNEKATLRREFFVSASSKQKYKLDLAIEGPVEQIPWAGDAPNCAICDMPIHKKWCDEVEAWVLDNGTVLNHDECVHRSCVL